MSNKEIAIDIINQIPEYKLSYVVDMLSSIKGLLLNDALEVEPNEETIAAMKETDEMIKNGDGQHFEGSAKDFINMLLEDK